MKLFKNLLLLLTGALIVRALLLSVDNSTDKKVENKVSIQDKQKSKYGN
ncbi:hypothetical protein [Staphylococcus equorum]